MNELEAFRNLRPDDEPFDAATDARIREALGLRTPRSDSDPGLILGEVVSGTTRTNQPAPADGQSRRRLAVLGAAAAVIAGLVGFIVVQDAATTSVDTGPADGPPPATDDDLEADPIQPAPDQSAQTTIPPVDQALDGLDDPQFVALAQAALSAADWNLESLDGQTSPTEPFGVEVFSDIGDGRVSFEIETIPPTGACPAAGWEQEFLNVDTPGTPTADGLLFVDETADPASRTAIIVSNESVATVRSEQVPFADLPDWAAFADTAQAISAETPFILNGGERPRFYEVRCGDLLTLIAGRFDSSVDELIAFNELSDENAIQVGMVLEIPPDTTAEVPDPAEPDEASAEAPVPVAPGEIMVANANTYGGSAGQFSGQLTDAGFGVTNPVNSTLSNVADSVIYIGNNATCLGIQLSYATGITKRESMPDVLPIESPIAVETPDVLIVLGNDIATKVAGDTVDIDLGPTGTLTVIDATDDDSLVDAQLATLRTAGIDVAAVLPSRGAINERATRGQTVRRCDYGVEPAASSRAVRVSLACCAAISSSVQTLAVSSFH